MALLVHGGHVLNASYTALERADILIEADRIQAVGQGLEVPPEAHRLDAFRGRGWRRHEQVVRRGTTVFEHLNGTDSRGQIVLFRSAVAIQGRAIGEEVFERPVISQTLEQIVVRMCMGVDQAR